jgi:integrase
LVVPLHTDSLTNANRLKFRVIAELQDKIARARAETATPTKPHNTLLAEEALDWKADIQNQQNPGAKFALRERVGEVERREGPEKASYFMDVATGAATPIMSLVDTWLAERDMKPRQKIDYVRAVRKFSGWVIGIRLNGAIEEVTRKVAGRYVSEALVARKIHWKTANKDITALSGYWKWLMRRGNVEYNVWTNQALPKVKPKSDQQRPKRPFTDAEVLKLFRSIEPGMLRDAMLVAALSGLRTGEIAQLRVGDCYGGEFSITSAKTAAGVRDVPIHEDLAILVSQRSARKARADYLFHELKDPRPGTAVERGQAITKQFVTARRRLGVDEMMDNCRQSRIDFHSFRRWFIAKARNALQNGASGFDQWTICEVVGHDTEAAALGMTMGRYAGKQLAAARRACVNSVKLPVMAKEPIATAV